MKPMKAIRLKTNKYLFLGAFTLCFLACWCIPLLPFFKGDDVPAFLLLHPQILSDCKGVVGIVLLSSIAISSALGWVIHALLLLVWDVIRNWAERGRAQKRAGPSHFTLAL